jgi:O-acetyl-ADP-ribose deacetylase (regulator of RNase III)
MAVQAGPELVYRGVAVRVARQAPGDADARVAPAAHDDGAPGSADVGADGVIDALVPAPEWQGGHRGEFVALERAYSDALRRARRAGARRASVRPLVGPTDPFPPEQAIRVALATVCRVVRDENLDFESVTFVVDEDGAYSSWLTALDLVRRTYLGTPATAG